MLRFVTCFLTVWFLSVINAAQGGEAMAPAGAWIPQDAVLVLEIAEPKAILNQVFTDRVVKAIADLPPIKEQLAKPQSQQALVGIRYFGQRHNRDLRSLLGGLLGGGITLAVLPKDGVLLIVDAEDAKLLDDLHEFIRLMAEAGAQDRGPSKRVASAEYRGVTGWSFGPNESHAIVGTRLLMSNKPEVLKAALDLRDSPDRANLAKLATYQSARKSIGPRAAAGIFANMGVLRKLPRVERSLRNNENPLATLLFTPLAVALRDATWLTASLAIQDRTVSLRFASDGSSVDTAAPEGFAMPARADGGALANLTVPRQIAGFSLFRDLNKFYAAKDTLFPERTSGLVFFENMMGIFFTGRDFTEEVLAETQPEIRLVVAEQQYEASAGTPQPRLPGFAAVFRLRDPKKFGLVVEEAWQKGLGLINFTRGQQALPGLIIDRPVYRDVKYTMAYFAPERKQGSETVDVRFNFQPTLALMGDCLILSSCDGLTRDLIDALRKESEGGRKPVLGKHSLGELSGRPLASILEANREALIRQNMVEQGNSREKAEGELTLLMTLIKQAERLQIVAGSKDGRAELELQLDVVGLD